LIFEPSMANEAASCTVGHADKRFSEYCRKRCSCDAKYSHLMDHMLFKPTGFAGVYNHWAFPSLYANSNQPFRASIPVSDADLAEALLIRS
jgi:hypothetical protein